MNKKKEITIKDLARLSGFSVATVSRSLNDSPLVKKATKEKILALVDEVGFECNANARGLATSKVDTIGIILPPAYDKFDQHLYYSSLMNDLREDLEKSNCDLIVSFSTNRFTGKNNIVRLVNRKKVDGLIILREHLEQHVLEFLEKKKVPYIFSHYCPLNDTIPCDAVYPDHLWGGKIAADHLASSGYTRMLCLCAEGSIREFDRRVEGFTQVLHAYGIAFSEQDVLPSPLTVKDGFRVITDHAARFQGIDAIFAVTDLLAFGAMEAIKTLGFRVPEDIAIVGYDDIPLAAELNPPLSSVHQPREEMASETCKRLLQKIDGKGGRYKAGARIVVRPYLVVRESSGGHTSN